MVDAAFLYIIGGIGYLIAGALYFEWRLRRLWRTLPQRAFASISEALFVEEVSEAGGAPRTRLAVPFRAIAGQLADELTPLFVERALKSVKVKLPTALPAVMGEGGQIDLNAILGMLPKRYQGMAALALPLLQRFLPNLGSSTASQSAGRGSGGSGWG